MMLSPFGYGACDSIPIGLVVGISHGARGGRSFCSHKAKHETETGGTLLN